MHDMNAHIHGHQVSCMQACANMGLVIVYMYHEMSRATIITSIPHTNIHNTVLDMPDARKQTQIGYREQRNDENTELT